MNLQNRIDLFVELGNYLEKNDASWQEAKRRASHKNPWFTEDFSSLATGNIIRYFLQKNLLTDWVNHYHLDDNINPKNIGIVMAGNIPLVGFHDMLTTFISGHRQTIKLSSKDDVLPDFVVQYLYSLDPAVKQYLSIADSLKGCDAYIATGGNQSARYFEQYFSRFPHIIRKNKTSVALLTGDETKEELEALSDDIHLFFGLGCRNVTKIYVPEGYDFIPLLASFNKFIYFRDYTKYSNNYDYQLSILLLNHQYYMTNENTLLVENENLFSPISVLNYEYYQSADQVAAFLNGHEDVQCIVGKGHTPFGKAQEPGLMEYADGVDTMQFMLGL
jgi:hypothetical protein